jgi:hypothetical protein
MSAPWVPPYFGSWDELVQSVLDAATNTLGGSGGRPPGALMMRSALGASPWSAWGPGPQPWVFGSRPGPVPWAWGPVPDPWLPPVSYLISVLSLKEVVGRIPNEQTQQEFSTRIDAAVIDIIDDWCPTRPRPWPWPGPPPWIIPIVSELAFTAHQLQEGRLKEDILQVAGQVIQKSLEAGRG